MNQPIEPFYDDKHLNLFYTYRTNHLEDNVTRALLITLSRLSPVHLRMFIRDLVLKDKVKMGDRLQLLAEPDFTFESQVCSPPDGERLLDANNGVIVGINLSGTQALTFGPSDSTFAGGARADALMADNANDITLIFESKLSDGLYREQIQRHFQRFFDAKLASLDQVFVEITWSDIANYLQRVKRQASNSEEQVTIGEFVQYLDLLGLVDFLGLQPSDFSEKNDRKLNSYLAFVVQSRGEELQLQNYGNDWKLHFKDVLYENVWCDIDESGIWCGIVCGSGKMWRAKSLREYILQKPNELQVVLEELQTDLGQKMQIVMRINSYFRHSRFRTAWLGNIGRAQVFPDGYETFIKTFTSPQLNSFERLTKERINEVFREEIEANTKRGLIHLDGQGRFPKWEDIPSFLQYCYFHIDVQLSSKSLIGKPVKDVTDMLASVLKSLHKAVLKLCV